MARYKYRKVTFYEPEAGNLLSVDHKRTEKGAVVEGVVVSTRELVNDISVKIEATLTRAEALEYIRDIADRIGGPSLAARLPREIA
jgi:hypothetical protein